MGIVFRRGKFSSGGMGELPSPAMIRPVSYATILDDPSWPTLLAEYSAECSLPELGTPNPQRDLYAILEKSGGFQAFGVYEEDKLVGFASVLIYVLPHYGKKIATTESMFVREKFGAFGLELKQVISQYARENLCCSFIYSAPCGSRFDKLLSFCHPHTNNVYLETL